jgi:hypothetical protein
VLETLSATILAGRSRMPLSAVAFGLRVFAPSFHAQAFLRCFQE